MYSYFQSNKVQFFFTGSLKISSTLPSYFRHCLVTIFRKPIQFKSGLWWPPLLPLPSLSFTSPRPCFLLLASGGFLYELQLVRLLWRLVVDMRDFSTTWPQLHNVWLENETAADTPKDISTHLNCRFIPRARCLTDTCKTRPTHTENTPRRIFINTSTTLQNNETGWKKSTNKQQCLHIQRFSVRFFGVCSVGAKYKNHALPHAVSISLTHKTSTELHMKSQNTATVLQGFLSQHLGGNLRVTSYDFLDALSWIILCDISKLQRNFRHRKRVSFGVWLKGNVSV